MKTLKRVDVAIVGGGWTGLAMAKEITERTGLSVLILASRGWFSPVYIFLRKLTAFCTQILDGNDLSIRNYRSS